jgi:hypothetical protein
MNITLSFAHNVSDAAYARTVIRSAAANMVPRAKTTIQIPTGHNSHGSSGFLLDALIAFKTVKEPRLG